MTSQIQRKILTYPITDVKYSIHQKAGSPDSLRVDYWSGLKRVGSEWVCFEHTGWARAKADAWWKRRNMLDPQDPAPFMTAAAFALLSVDDICMKNPSTITVNETGKWPEIINVSFEPVTEAA